MTRTAHIAKVRALRWLTCRLEPVPKEAVWAAAEAVSTGDVDGGHTSLNSFLKPLHWPEKLKIALIFGVWENVVENPMRVVLGFLSVPVLIITMLTDLIHQLF